MENSICLDAIEQVNQGANIRVDFKKRALFINNKQVDIPAPKPETAYRSEFDSIDNWLDVVEDLYDAYKYSRPTKSSMGKERKAYFKALSAEELVKECGHSALNNPKTRDEAQAELELFILFSLINGDFNPDELFGKDWFYQGADKSFIMYKDWF